VSLLDATPFLKALGADATPQMEIAVNAWAQEESGGHITGNNPWNLHVGPPCPPDAPAAVLGVPHSQRLNGPGGLIGNRYAGPGDKNVAIYGTRDEGVAASAERLLAYQTYGYPRVVAAARLNDPILFLEALAASSWSAGRYGTVNGGPNRLLAIYQSLGGMEPVITITVTINQFAAARTGSVPAGTRRFALAAPHAELGPLIDAATLAFDATVVVDSPQGPHGTFLRTITTPAYLISSSVVTLAPVPPAPPAADAVTAVNHALDAVSAAVAAARPK
jgi:hypothetical protein